MQNATNELIAFISVDGRYDFLLFLHTKIAVTLKITEMNFKIPPGIENDIKRLKSK